MAELGGNRGSVLDSVKQRLFSRTRTKPGQLMSNEFISRVGTPRLSYHQIMQMGKAPKYYRPRVMAIVHRAIAEAVVSTAEMTLKALAQTAPVYTGTWVANYRLDEQPTAQFNQTAGFWPQVVRGTPREAEARKRPIAFAKRIAFSLVHYGTSRGDNYKFYLMNATPYRPSHAWVVQRIEDATVKIVKSEAARQLPARVAKRIVRLNNVGRR